MAAGGFTRISIPIPQTLAVAAAPVPFHERLFIRAWPKSHEGIRNYLP